MKTYKPSDIQGTTEYGGNVKFIIDDSPDYAVGQFMLEKGESLGPESHDNDEFFYVISGSVNVDDVDNHDSYTIKAGEIIIIKKGEVHKTNNINEEMAVVLWVCGK